METSFEHQKYLVPKGSNKTSQAALRELKWGLDRLSQEISRAPGNKKHNGTIPESFLDELIEAFENLKAKGHRCCVCAQLLMFSSGQKVKTISTPDGTYYLCKDHHSYKDFILL